MRPNICLIEFDEDRNEATADFISSVIDRDWSIAILRNSQILKDFGSIDLWWLSDDGGLSLLFATILAKRSRKLKIYCVYSSDSTEDRKDKEKGLKVVLKKFRIDAEVVLVGYSATRGLISPEMKQLWESLTNDVEEPPNIKQITKSYLILGDLIRSSSADSDCAIVSLPIQREAVPNRIYLSYLSVLTFISIPVLLVRGNETQTLTSSL